MSTYKIWKFQCNNPECKSHKKLIEITQWSDDPIPICIECRQPLEDYIINTPTFLIPKFANASPGEKRRILKERSNRHFKREIAEKKHWMDNN